MTPEVKPAMRHTLCLILSTFLFVACRQEPALTETASETAPGSASTTTSGTPKPAPENAAVKEVDVLLSVNPPAFATNVMIGTAVNPDGSITTAVTEFPRGAPIWVSMKLTNPPSGSMARVDWFDSKGKSLAAERKEALPNAPYLTFRSVDTSSWKPGQYRVEAWMGGDKVDEKTFAIEGKKSPKKSSKK